MANPHDKAAPESSLSSSDVELKPSTDQQEKAISPAVGGGDIDNLQYPPPWKWEKLFPGGYSQGRMFKFKKSKNMYMAINLFAGVAIMFYGYDQGVMSQVNLNEDYWNTMGINSPKGKCRPISNA